MKVVNPYDEWVTGQTEGESLTLFTCAEQGTKRFVVKCEPVNNTDQQDGEHADQREGVVPLGVNNLEVKSVRNDERKVGLYEL